MAELTKLYVHDITPETIKEIKDSLFYWGTILVHNTHETFYGWGFERDLRKGLSDINCEINIKKYDHIEGFPCDFEIMTR